MIRSRIKSMLCAVLAIALLSLAAFCLWTRTPDIPLSSDSMMLAAAALSLPDGLIDESERDKADKPQNNTDSLDDDKGMVPVSVSTYDESVFSEDPSVYSDEKHYPVIETQYSSGDFGYNDFFVKNSTDYIPDIGEYLKRPLGFDFEQNDSVQVLIYHTHTCESYLTYDAGTFHESFYPRSEDSERNMIRVGEAICDSLRREGIGVVHATEVHDSPAYDGAYYRSEDTVKKYLEKYPDIKVTIDVHRDSISYGDYGGKIKPTFTVDGKKAAQIMIMAGYDPDGYYSFPFWEDNLSFALKLQDVAEKMYPGMTRPLYFGNFAYNMNINNGSLLIEVGTDVNTLSEAVYTGNLLGNVLARVLQTA